MPPVTPTPTPAPTVTVTETAIAIPTVTTTTTITPSAAPTIIETGAPAPTVTATATALASPIEPVDSSESDNSSAIIFFVVIAVAAIITAISYAVAYAGRKRGWATTQTRAVKDSVTYVNVSSALRGDVANGTIRAEDAYKVWGPLHDQATGLSATWFDLGVGVGKATSDTVYRSVATELVNHRNAMDVWVANVIAPSSASSAAAAVNAVTAQTSIVTTLAANYPDIAKPRTAASSPS